MVCKYPYPLTFGVGLLQVVLERGFDPRLITLPLRTQIKTQAHNLMMGKASCARDMQRNQWAVRPTCAPHACNRLACPCPGPVGPAHGSACVRIAPNALVGAAHANSPFACPVRPHAQPACAHTSQLAYKLHGLREVTCTSDLRGPIGATRAPASHDLCALHGLTHIPNCNRPPLVLLRLLLFNFPMCFTWKTHKTNSTFFNIIYIFILI